MNKETKITNKQKSTTVHFNYKLKDQLIYLLYPLISWSYRQPREKKRLINWSLSNQPTNRSWLENSKIDIKYIKPEKGIKSHQVCMGVSRRHDHTNPLCHTKATGVITSTWSLHSDMVSQSLLIQESDLTDIWTH